MQKSFAAAQSERYVALVIGVAILEACSPTFKVKIGERTIPRTIEKRREISLKLLAKNQNVMIPTRYKSRLSHLMSYSISAGTLSKALEDIPEINELSVAFFDSCQNPRKLENPCRVLSIGYFYKQINLTSENKSIGQDRYGAKWEITVYPVPRTCVSAVKNQLDEEGLDKICQWLYLYQDATGKDGNCWLHLLYDMNANRLSYKEHGKLSG